MKYKLNIEKPCEQSWEKMKPTEGGRYCLHCSKNVIDFTNLSDKEIIKIITQSSGRMCGQLTADQLNRAILYRKEKATPPVFSEIAASFLLIGLTLQGNSFASTKINPSIAEYPSVMEKEQTKTKKIVSDTNKITVKGRVLDAKTGESLPGTTILSGDYSPTNPCVTATDIQGCFTLKVPSGESKIALIVSAVGYFTQKIYLNVDGLTEQEILLKPDERVMGEMVITVYKAKWWQVGKRFKNWKTTHM